jgi:hypothetical protein
VGGVDVDRVVLELHGLAPEEFKAARNALVKATKAAGEHTASDSLKALRKPTLAAWLANQLVRTDPDQVNDLTELGGQLREAHLSADGPRGRSPRCSRSARRLAPHTSARSPISKTPTLSVEVSLPE